MKRIIAGTTNPAKLAALRQLLSPIADVIAPPIPGHPDAEETGTSLAEIAAGKATAWSEWLVARDVALPVIVTDGGLTIPALGGRWDPTRTRRFAGDGLTSLQRATALLSLCSDLTGEDRAIGWTEVAVIVAPGERPAIHTAESPPGLLASSVRTEHHLEPDGFWVPAIWLCPEYELKRLIDLTIEERVHRADHWDRLGEAVRSDLRGFLRR